MTFSSTVNIQYGTSFERIGKINDIYICVSATEGFQLRKANKSGLSGHYKYHSTKDGTDIFALSGPKHYTNYYTNLRGEQFFLIYRNGFWFFTNEIFAPQQKWPNEPFVGFLRLQTKGIID